jgi:hypothetical protein
MYIFASVSMLDICKLFAGTVSLHFQEQSHEQQLQLCEKLETCWKTN